MKFADKYELSDAVTNGRLETFMGRDVGSGERVLVHIFDAPVKKPDQPTVLWVLESFRAIAPEPPGLVISAGRYGGTSYAYLVTQVPDDAALRKWQQGYESSMADTREIPVERTFAPENPPVAPSVPAAAAIGKPANPPTGFFGLRPPAEISVKPDEVVTVVEKAPDTSGNQLEGISFGPRPDMPRRDAGEFTKQFFVGSNDLPKPPVNPVQASRAPVPPASPNPAPAAPRGIDRNARVEATSNTSPSLSPVEGGLPEVGGFTAMFRPGPQPEISEMKDAPRRIDTSRKADDAKGGDFTRFFQGPFDGERPAEIPDVSPNVTNTPRGKVPGEFTQMFGAAKDNPFAASFSPGLVKDSPPPSDPNSSNPGSFTRSFSDASHLSSKSDLAPPIGESKGNGSEKAPAFVEPKWTEPVPSSRQPPMFEPSVIAQPPAVPTASAPRESRPSVQGGATQLFSVPGAHSAPSLPPPPSGPSEYTRIISGGITGLASAEEQPAVAEGPAAGGLPTFKMPAAAVPPAPKIAPPKLPTIPPAPKVPPVGALVPKPKSSYLPMIIILNVSLIIAVLLIVYFAIKH